ncbi:hypothetical protein [Luteibacter sp. SG786]|uniref:hypothetical protein n=1 Tax=Luteibacter sp. SG786 TaxID=2587130 RepID=UPI0014207127|nr:hypothetical protein [Luteibacter sp. SG786]
MEDHSGASDESEKALILSAIERTGFPLENRTARAFAEAGWSTVSNKYYVDDLSGEVREIDLIAYKVHRHEEYSVYSAIIVSCKRTSDNKWVFMTRPAKPFDPNVNSTPLHFWTNDPAIEYPLSRNKFPEEFNEALATHSPSIWGVPKHEIFGFQELVAVTQSKKNAPPEITRFSAIDDRAMFSSIKSLMKAQAYELGRLGSRWKKPAVYVFSLLAVMDGDMLEVSYQEKDPSIEETKLQNYIAHYIIKGAEQFSRINFVHASSLPGIIKELDAAHTNTVAQVDAARKGFFATVLSNADQRGSLIPAFGKKVLLAINVYGKFRGDEVATEDSIDLFYHREHNQLEIQLNNTLDEAAIQLLNGSENLMNKTRDALKQIFKYDGNFTFTTGLPF